MSTDDRLVQEAFAVAKAAYSAADIEAERREYNASLASLFEEVERLRAALHAVKDLALADAPGHMIVDVCDRTFPR